MALSPAVVGFVFLICVLGALGFMAYLGWRGSKPSDFFSEAVAPMYEMELADKEIDTYYDMKERLQRQHAPETLERDPEEEAVEADEEPWTRKVPPEERQALQKALMQRLVACIGKLDQVQKDKPGNWKLWQSKLISERFWSSLCDAEKIVSQEIDSCVAEAQEIEPGWREHIFPQAVQLYRMQKVQEQEKKVAKKVVETEKKKEKNVVKRAEVEKRMEEEEKIRQEKTAEKMMKQLLLEEERNSKTKGKTKLVAAKPKAKKK